MLVNDEQIIHLVTIAFPPSDDDETKVKLSNHIHAVEILLVYDASECRNCLLVILGV
jgi:hypothetical protein